MLKVALAQFKPVLGNKLKNLEKIEKFLIKAKQQESDIVLFPELALTGYLIEDILNETAESLDGKSILYIKQLCAKLKLHCVFTFPEKQGGFYFNSAALIDDNGQLVGVYRKTHLFDTEEHYFKKGTQYPVFETKLGRLATMICYDVEFPEVSRIYRLKKADIILISTANMHPYQDYQMTYIKSRAMENEFPIAICNRIGTEGDMVFFGNSAVINPFGKVQLLMNDQEGIETIPITLKDTLDPRLNYINNRYPLIYGELTKYD